MKLRIFIITIACVITSCETNIFGPNEGTITGYVKELRGTPVSGATIKITYFEVNKDGNKTEKSITRASDMNGKYIAEVPLAEIGILISKNGYEEVLFYDNLEQSNPDREFTSYLQGYPSISDLKVTSPIDILSNDTLYFRLNITDNYKFKKQEPYLASLILFSKNISIHSIDFEIPFFSSSFKVVNGQAKLNMSQGVDTLKAGDYNLKVIVKDPDDLVSDTARVDLRIN